MPKVKRANIPNVISGGIATPLGNNMYLMIGRTHEQGGIDVGNTKNGLEVENGEVLKANKKSVKVFSAKPILNGNSPAELVIKGINPEDVFNAQEKFKDKNNLKDDGTSARLGRFSRVKQNDSPTKEISSGYEDYVNKIISKRGSLSNSKKYYIPYLYDKEIKVRGAGRMSSNMLDSIAVNANKAKIPFNEALGLAVQETHGGAMPTIAVPAGMDKDKVRAHFNMSYARNYGGIPAEYLINDYEYHNKGYKGSKNNDLTNIESPLQHGFTMYKRGLYNPGDKNHSNDVRAAGNKAVSSPDVQKWIQENGKKYNIKRMGGLNRKQDYGSKRKPYPTVNSSDFAGGNRSYPIPTKADAIDALRLAGLHGRNDVKAKVYAKYPSLKKANLGTKVEDMQIESLNLQPSIVTALSPSTIAAMNYTANLMKDIKENKKEENRKKIIKQNSIINNNKSLKIIKFKRNALGGNNNFDINNYISKLLEENSKQIDNDIEESNLDFEDYLRNNQEQLIQGYTNQIGGSIKAPIIGEYGPLAVDDKRNIKYISIPNGWLGRMYNTLNEEFVPRKLRGTKLIHKVNEIENPNTTSKQGLTYTKKEIPINKSLQRTLNRISKRNDKYINNLKIEDSSISVPDIQMDLASSIINVPKLKTSYNKRKIQETFRKSKQNTPKSDEYKDYASYRKAEIENIVNNPVKPISKETIVKPIIINKSSEIPQPIYTKYTVNKDKNKKSYANQQDINSISNIIGKALPSSAGKLAKSSYNTVVDSTDIRQLSNKGYAWGDTSKVKYDYYGKVKQARLGTEDKIAVLSKFPIGLMQIQPGNIIYKNNNTSTTIADDVARLNATGTINPSTGRQPKAASDFSIGSDLIRGTADLVGSIASYKINKDMIDKMKINNYVPYQRYKLKTNYNINPQLDSTREQINSMIDESKHNTASSRTDLARRQRYRNLGIRNINELYGQKENIETQLINQDILNAQRTSQQNTQLVNDYLRRKAEMDNKLAELNAENKVSLAQNAVGVVGDYFDRRETRNREALDRAVIAASNPNAISYMDNELPKLARQFGYRPLTFNFSRFRKNK